MMHSWLPTVLRRFWVRCGGEQWMSPQEEALWANARTLAEVAELVARWLAGEIAFQPGYSGPVDVDEDLAPGMTAALIAVNRAGFLTDQSQGAISAEVAAAKGYLERHAYVAGVATQAAWPLVIATRAKGLRLAAAYWSESHIRHWWTGYGVCHRDAVREILAAKRVRIYDPELGRNDRLWPALLAAAQTTTHQANQSPPI